MVDYNITKYRINELRTDRDMTQEEFSKFVGISRQSIGFYESGKRLPDSSTIKLMCEKCCVTSDWLLGLSDVKLSSDDEQVLKYKQSIQKELGRVQKLVDSIDCYGAVCVYVNDLTDTIDKHVGLFEDMVDALDWLYSYKELYVKFDIPSSYFLLKKGQKPKAIHTIS